MKLVYSRVLAAIVLGSSIGFAAEATNLEEVFTQGELSGTIGWFGQHIDAKGDTPNSGFSNGYLNVGFETAPLHGISVGVSGWGSVKTSEKNDDDYKSAIADQSVLSQAYLKVEHEGMGKMVLGRQEVDFNWLTDYIDGVSAEISAVENLVVSMAWARKQATIDIDEISEEFTKLNGSKGIYMLEAKYTPIEALELNPYLYYGDNLLSAYGLKATLNLELSEEIKTSTMAHYVTINSDVADTKDGSFTQVEQGVELFGAKVALGYIKVDKDGMAGLGSFGDQLPFEEGNHAMDADAKTPYISAEYEIEGVTLATIYGQTKYLDSTSGDKLKEKEFNFSVGYEFMKNLETSLMYVNVDNDVKDDSYNAIKAHVAYKF
jgi:hypothetical protein